MTMKVNPDDTNFNIKLKRVVNIMVPSNRTR